jgi:TP901 family phage tail tape measure protein
LSEFRIKASIDLSDKEARAKINGLQNKTIHANLDLNQKGLDKANKKRAESNKRIADEQIKHQNRIAENDQKHQQRKELENQKHLNKMEQQQDKYNRRMNEQEKKFQLIRDRDAEIRAERTARRFEQARERERKRIERTANRHSNTQDILNNDLKAYRAYGKEISKIEKELSRTTNADKRRALTQRQNEILKSMDAEFAIQAKKSTAHTKALNALDKHMFGVARGEAIVAQYGKIEKASGKIKDNLSNIQNPLSRAYTKKTQKDLDNIVQSVNRNEFNPLNVKSASTRLERSRKEQAILNKMNVQEGKNLKSYAKITDTLNGGFNNIAIENRANNLNKGLENTFKNLDSGKLIGTANNISRFGKELEYAGKAGKQLGKLDRVADNLSRFEHVLKPKQLTKFREELVGLSRDETLGTAQYESKMRRLNTRISKIGKFQERKRTFGKDLVSTAFGSTMGYVTGYGARMAIGSMVQAYKDLDASMVNIKKVADPGDVKTVKQLDNIRRAAIRTAKDVGMSSADVQNSIAVALQSGMGGMKESLAVARKSMILANVGDMNKTEASSAVNTIVKSFGLSPLGKMHMNVRGVRKETTQLSEAMDVLNHLGNNYAISSAGVAEGLRQSGGVMHAYGVSLRDSAALITTANESLQDPNRVGNGMKSIAINMAGISASAKDGSLKLNKTAMALKNIAGIDVFADRTKGKIKSMTQVFDELAPKWKNLTDEQRFGLSEAIAGKHRANVFQALMGNYEQFNKIRRELSSGEHFQSAEKENEKYVNSLAGKANRAKETLTSLATTLVSSKMSYGVMDGFTSIGSGLEKIVMWADKANLTLPTLITGVAGARALFKGFQGQAKTFDEIMFGTPETKGTSIKDRFLNKFKAKKSDIEATTSDTVNTIEKAGKKIDESLVNASNGRLDIDKKDSKQPISKGGRTGNVIPFSNKPLSNLEKVDETSTQASKGVTKLKNSFGGMKEKIQPAMMAVGDFGKSVVSGLAGMAGGMIATAGVTFAVSKLAEAGYNGYQELVHGVELSKQKHLEHRDSIIANNKQIQSNLAYVKQNGKAYDELRKQVESFAKTPMDKWTAEQKQQAQELGNINQKIASMLPSLVKGYDDLGNPILTASANSETLTKRLQAQADIQARILRNNNNLIADKNLTQMLSGEKIGSGAIDKITSLNNQITKLSLSAHTVNSKNRDLAIGLFTNAEDRKRTGGPLQDAQVKMFSSSGQAFLSAKKDYIKQSQQLDDKINEQYNQLAKNVAKYDEANLFNTNTQLENLRNNSRFKKFGDSMRDSLSELGSVMTWGKIQRPMDAMNALTRMGDKLKPDQIKNFAKEIRELNESYAIGKDWEKYSKGIDKVADSIAKATGTRAKDWGERIKDVNRGFANVDEQREFNYMKNHGTSFEDLWSKNDVKAHYADQIQQNYRALKESKDAIVHAMNSNQYYDAISGILANESVPKSVRNIAKAVKDSGAHWEDGSKAILAYSDILEKVNPKSEQGAKGISALARSLEKGEAHSIDFGNGISLAKDVVEQLIKSGIKSKDIEIDLNAKVNTQAFKNVDEFYKNKKIEIPIDVKAKIADANLTDKQLEGLERATSQIEDKFKNAFRGKASQYARGTDGSADAIFKNMAKTSQGWRDAIDSGAYNQVAQFSNGIKEIKKAFDQLTPSMKSALKNMNTKDWRSYLDTFNSLSPSVQKLATQFEWSSKAQLDAANSIFKRGTNLGMSEGQVNKAINVAVKYSGKDITEIDKMIKGLPDETYKHVIVALNGENGQEFSQSLGKLFELTGGDQSKVKKVLEVILEEDGNLDKLYKMTDKELEQRVNAIVNMSEWERAKASIVNNPIIQWVITKFKNEGKSDPIKDKAKSVQKEGKNATPTPLIGQQLKYDEPAVKDATKKLSVKIEGQNKINNLLAQIMGIPTHRNTNINARDNTKQATTTAKQNIGQVPKQSNTSLKAHDHASGVAGAAKGSVLSFGRIRPGVPVLRVIDSASGAISRAIGMLSRFGGAKSVSLTAHLTTIRHNIVKTIKEATNKFNKWAASGGSGKITRDQRKHGGMNNGILGGASLHVSPTQINPLALKPAGEASPTGSGTSTTNYYGGVASPMAMSAQNLAETFKTIKLPGYEYKGIVDVHNLVYTAKQIKTAFKEDINVLREFERGIVRIQQAVKHLDISIQHARGNVKRSLMDLQNDIMREQIRRSLGKEKVAIGMRDTYRNEMRSKGWKFDSKGSVVNAYAKELAIKTKIHDIEKKSEKAKDKQKKKYDEEKKNLEKELKLLTEYEKMQDTISDGDYQRKELKYKIQSNEDEKYNMAVRAWKDNFEAASLVVESRINKVSQALDILSMRANYAFGYERLANMDAQIAKFGEMQSAIDSSVSAYKNLQNNLKNKLQSEGFSFSGDTMTNYQEHLAQLNQTSSRYDSIKDLANQYMDLINTKLPEATRKQEEYNQKLKDMNKKKLEDTKNIEDKIVAMLKRNQEEKIRLIEKENKTREEALRKRKEEYDLARKEVDYQNDYHKQLKEIEKVRKKLQIYARDDSQYGQKQYQKYKEELDKLQENLSKTVGKHVDDSVHKIIDDEIKRMQETVNQQREQNEKKTDVDLLKQAKRAIQTGEIEDATGKIVSLQKALTEYFDKFEGGLGATGALIKGEIIGQLKVANDVVANFSNILNTLGASSYASHDYGQSDRFNELKSKESSSVKQDFNAPLVNIQGGSTNDADFHNKVLKVVEDTLERFLRDTKNHIR